MSICLILMEQLQWVNLNLPAKDNQFCPPKDFISLVEIAALCKAGIIKIFALPTILKTDKYLCTSDLKLHLVAFHRQNRNLPFFFEKINCFSYMFVFLEIGFPKVECDRKATLGSKPKSLATLTRFRNLHKSLSSREILNICISD